jgi:chromosomal replication initiator protein
MWTQAHKDLWATVREDLRVQLGETLFDRWIGPLKLLTEEGDAVRLGVPNLLVQGWVETKYLTAIVKAFSARRGAETRVSLEIDAALFQKHRQSSAGILGSNTVSGTSVEISPAGTVKETTGAGDSTGRDFPLMQEQTLDSFVVGPSNELAWGAAKQIFETPGGLYNPLFLHGPSGVGKTHLLRGLYRDFRARRLWGRQAKKGRGSHRRGSFCRVRYVTGEQFYLEYSSQSLAGTLNAFRERYRSLDVLVVDDVQLLRGKPKSQIEFLRTFSSLVESGRQVILASDVSPRSLEGLDPGLVGRFLSGLVVGIRKPDYGTRLGIVRAQSRRLGNVLDDRVLEFLARNVRGTARELLGALMRLDIHAQVLGEPLSYDGARDILSDIVEERRRAIDLKRIRDVVAQYFGHSPDALQSRSRQRQIARARQIAMYLARRHTGKSLAEIGKYFGNRNHATVKSAELRISSLLDQGDRVVTHGIHAILENL